VELLIGIFPSIGNIQNHGHSEVGSDPFRVFGVFRGSLFYSAPRTRKKALPSGVSTSQRTASRTLVQTPSTRLVHCSSWRLMRSKPLLALQFVNHTLQGVVSAGWTNHDEDVASTFITRTSRGFPDCPPTWRNRKGVSRKGVREKGEKVSV